MGRWATLQKVWIIQNTKDKSILSHVHCVHCSLLSFCIISYIFMWVTMNAIGKSIRTGRYTDSFTQPVCAGTERQNALPWAGFSWVYLLDLGRCDILCCLCLADFILFWTFDISMYHLIVSVAPWWTRQSSPNSPSCWRKGSWRRSQREALWRPQRWPTMEMFTYCTLTPNIIKAVRETMAGAINATVEMTGGHLDLSDISD